MNSVLIIGIVGPTCSGKTTVSRQIKSALGDKCDILSQDHFYFGGSPNKNYDVPSSIDFPELVKALKTLKSGEAANIPQYDFNTHSRLKETILFKPKKIIIVEGILLLCDSDTLDLLDIKVYIKSDTNETRKRRLRRDVSERGRTRESVIKQYNEHVVPSNLAYVEPSQSHADHLLIDNSDFTFEGMEKLLTEIRNSL